MAGPPDNPALRLTVLDDGTARTDLAGRHELKYVFRATDIEALRAVLHRRCRPVVYNEAVSTVRSVYFDDARLSTCRANLDGISDRRKVRIRWYDRPAPGLDFFLEVKWRRNRVTGKHRLHLGATGCPGDLGWATLHAALRRDLPRRHLAAALRYPDAIVLVEYRREHFVSVDGTVRLTLDRDLTFWSQAGRRRLTNRFGDRLDDVVILEGKVPVGCAHLLRPLLSPIPARIERFSKYVVGCHRLRLAATD